MRLFIGPFLAFVPALAVAQVQPHFGVIAGLPFTDTLQSSSSFSETGAITDLTRYNSETKRIIVGPEFRLDFAAGFGFALDAIYQRVDYDFLNTSSPPLDRTFQALAANRWQFPLLIEYRRKLGKIAGFAGAGPSIQHYDAGSGVSSSYSAAVGSSPPSSSTNSVTGVPSTSAGITVAVGVNIPVFRLHLRPEFRYSHWFSPAAVPQAVGFVFTATALPEFLTLAPAPSLTAKANEASLLLGLTF